MLAGWILYAARRALRLAAWREQVHRWTELGTPVPVGTGWCLTLPDAQVRCSSGLAGMRTVFTQGERVVELDGLASVDWIRAQRI